MQTMLRKLVYLLAAAWSASAVAQGPYAVMENDDQRLAFSQLPGEYQSPAHTLYTPGRIDKPGLLALLTHGRLSLNWRFEEVPVNRLERQSLFENRQAFPVRPSPAIKLDMSGSSIELHRKGLRYQPKKTSVFFDLSYRDLNPYPKVAPDRKSDLNGTKGVSLGVGFTF